MMTIKMVAMKRDDDKDSDDDDDDGKLMVNYDCSHDYCTQPCSLYFKHQTGTGTSH